MTFLLDTNVLLRFLVGDEKSQQKKAISWFKQAEKGKIKIIVTPIVIAESAFVLESFYKQSKAEIGNCFEVFLSQRWLQVESREALLG
ncbi:PIN domain-containing protein, partial [Candidatus Gribaldobacteria bacterium]|nr:PIN domain-containing protein [Candidatus Gribaldobacteria bacterium]